MSRLAINGGKPARDARTNPWPKWPVWDGNDANALLKVLNSGVWSYNGPQEIAFNKAFADFIGAKYCVCAVNGTITLQLALEACGIGYGDEVILPGLTWQATAATVVDVNAVPVLVDVRADTWCIDAEKIAEAVTPRTKAIIPVHLFGGFADMDAIMEIARKHKLRVIEDCAHKHGGEWRGRKAGGIGDIGSFSFQLSKIMTAGEGGALTTSDPELAEKLDALRNCGRRPEGDEFADVDKGAGVYGSEGDFIQSGNYRITDFQAALLLEGLKRLPEQNRLRDENAAYANSLLAELPGVTPMPGDARETGKVWYNFAFRYDKTEFKGLPVAKFREALSKEIDFTVDASNTPLNDCPLYKPQTKPARHRLNEQYWRAVDPSRFDLPVCKKVFEEESVCLHHSVLMGTKADMDMLAAAIRKIYDCRDELS